MHRGRCSPIRHHCPCASVGDIGTGSIAVFAIGFATESVLIVIEAFIDCDVTIVVAPIAAKLITFFLSREWEAFGSASLKADVLIATEASATDRRGPFFIGDAITIIVGVVARGIDGNTWLGDTLFLACYTG